MKITDVQGIIVSPPSDTWAWVRVQTDRGLEGWGEFSGSPLSNASTGAVLAYLGAGLRGKDPCDMAACLGAIRQWRYPSHLDNRSIATAVSALDMALWDIRAKSEGVPLYALLGSAQPESIPLYANLNRLLRQDRSLQSLLNAAQAAVQDGLPMVKIAPFDEVTPEKIEPDTDPGVQRCEEVAKLIGEDRLSIDCHCRFTPETFVQLIQELGERAQRALFWEDPFRIHRACDVHALTGKLPSLRLASGEDCFYAGDLLELAGSGKLSILNPDIKYIGGISGASSLVPKLLSLGSQVCLHNPSGPIATAHSAQISTLCGANTMLEFAYGDQTTRDAAVGGWEGVEHGRYNLTDKPGVGVSPDSKFLEKYTIQIL